jgi:hypothetical protein
MKNDDDPVYAGCLDLLIGRKPHAFRSLGLELLSELVAATRLVEQQRRLDKQNIYEMGGKMHAHWFLDDASTEVRSTWLITFFDRRTFIAWVAR